MEHQLKISPQDYSRVKDGTKTFEVGDAQNGFQFGDIVIFKEWDPNFVNPTDEAQKGYTGSEELKFKVGYVHILTKLEVIFSLLPFKPKK